jgi:hypothetical protein
MPRGIFDTRPTLLQTRSGYRTDTCKVRNFKAVFKICRLTHTSVFVSGELAPDFYFKKTMATNTKGVLDFRSPKSDGNFFFLWEDVATLMCIGCRFKSSLK